MQIVTPQKFNSSPLKRDRAPKRKYSFQGPMLNFGGVLWGSIGKKLMSPLLMGKTTVEVEVGSFCSHYLQGCLYIPGG